MHYTQITLTLASDWHIGSGRAGMLAKTHRFVPGHVVSYALAAAIGKDSGGRYADFVKALQQVRESLRCGPLLLANPEQPEHGLLPFIHAESIEAQFLVASQHVTLHPETRSGVEGALFEMEAIAPKIVRGISQGQPARLVGGFWADSESLAGRSLQDWLKESRFGGELKAGLGRVAEVSLQSDRVSYAGWGRVDASGLHLAAGEWLPGVALNGVSQNIQFPWLGRLYDETQGFGRKLAEPVFVARDGQAATNTCFIPSNDEVGLGCWTLCS